MDIWDKLCIMLRARKVSVEDVSNKVHHLPYTCKSLNHLVLQTRTETCLPAACPAQTFSYPIPHMCQKRNLLQDSTPPGRIHNYLFTEYILRSADLAGPSLVEVSALLSIKILWLPISQ